MTAGGSKSLPSIGFLTITEHAEHGLFGGYLVLNTAARPLEFHCTAPVRPNRAQEILYGPTLKPFLYGEQIGQALVAKARQRPLWICTDIEHVLELRTVIEIPVVQLLSHDEERSETQSQSPRSASHPDSLRGDFATTRHRIDAAHESPACGHTHRFALGNFRVAVDARFSEDEQSVSRAWQQHAGGFDLSEPFERIRSAIEEAQRSAR
jgi:hypothetical protein